MKKGFRIPFVCLLPLTIVLGCSLQQSKTHVKFEVTGTAMFADLTYQYGAGLGTPNGVSLPWSFEYDGSKGDWCDLCAASDSGNLTVTIYIKMAPCG